MDANYVVMIVALIVWAGIFVYLLSLDKKIRKLENRNEG
jgi:CcmD family protein